MTSMKRSTSTRTHAFSGARWVFVAALAVCSALQSAQANVLEQVPSDATIVIKVKNLKQFSDRIANYAQQWGVAGLQPGMENPLGAFQQETGMTEGLATDGEMAIYLMEFPMDGEEPLPVGIFPVSDYQAFIGNFADAKTEGDITTATIQGESTTIMKRGNYAVIGTDREAVATPANVGLKPGEAPAKQLNEKDITVHLNVAPLREQLLPKIEEGRAEVMGKIDEIAGPDADEEAAAFGKYMPLVKAMAGQVLNVAEGLVHNTNSVTWGMTFGDNGISATYMADFTKDGYAAEVLGMMKPTDQSLLTGLPQGEYVVVGGSVTNPEAAKKLMSDFLAPIRAELGGEGAELQAMSAWLDAVETYVVSSTGQRFGMISPGEQGDISQIQTLNMMLGDANKIAEAQKNLLASQDEMMNAVITSLMGGGEAPDAAEGQENAKVETTLTPNAKTVEGVAFTEFATEAQVGSTAPQNAIEAGVQQMLAGMQMQNQSGVFGVVDPKHFLLSSGGTDEMLASAVKAAKSDEKAMAGNEQIAAADKALPKQRLSVVYVPLDVAVAAGVEYANANGMQMSIEVPPDLVPFAFSATTESDTAVRVDAFLPSETLQQLVAVGMQVQMQMQGNQQPGGPGGL